MGTEYLDQADLQCRNLAVPNQNILTSSPLVRNKNKRLHENAGQIELHLETNIDVSTINRRTPPKSESTIRNLVKTGTLCVGEFFISHRFFKT